MISKSRVNLLSDDGESYGSEMDEVDFDNELYVVAEFSAAVDITDNALRSGDGSLRLKRTQYIDALCSACGSESDELLVCTGCFSTKYCNEQCQRAHWNGDDMPQHGGGGDEQLGMVSVENDAIAGGAHSAWCNVLRSVHDAVESDIDPVECGNEAGISDEQLRVLCLHDTGAHRSRLSETIDIGDDVERVSDGVQHGALQMQRINAWVWDEFSRQWYRINRNKRHQPIFWQAWGWRPWWWRPWVFVGRGRRRHRVLRDRRMRGNWRGDRDTRRAMRGSWRRNRHNNRRHSAPRFSNDAQIGVETTRASDKSKVGVSSYEGRFKSLFVGFDISGIKNVDTIEKFDWSDLNKNIEDKMKPESDIVSLYVFLPKFFLAGGENDNIKDVQELFSTLRNNKFASYVVNDRYMFYLRWQGKGESKVPAALTGFTGGHMAVIAHEVDSDYVLLVRKNGSKYWSFAGGAGDIGESTLQTAVREVEEEVGIDLTKEKHMRIAYVGGYSKSTDRELWKGETFKASDNVDFYVARIFSKKGPKINDPDEIAEAKWFKINANKDIEYGDRNGKIMKSKKLGGEMIDSNIKVLQKYLRTIENTRIEKKDDMTYTEVKHGY